MGLTIGVDVGGTKVLAGVVDEDGQILDQERQVTPKTDPEAIAEIIAALVKRLRSRHEVEAVGIGAAGWIDLDRANVMFAPNLIWRNEPLKLRVSKHIDLPVVIENDANCHAWAETRFGAARGQSTAVAVILGTGIGGGIVLEGHLFRGGFGLAGEPGHVRVVPDGRLCGCGNRGCWEQYASGNALVREAKEIASSAPSSMPFLLSAVSGDVEAITGPLITEAAHAGDAGARRSFETIGRWVGQGLADLATILDPACFVVGGGPSDAGAVLIDPVREAFTAALSGGAFRPHAQILGAELGSSAGLVGAADLARIR
jgi:glucokinase